ncbi:MAG: PSD1 and planctomycete cytochrome C domain-containing protein [Acidobacteriota bacterium]
MHGQEPEKADFFESRIRPLFSTNCYTCHTGAQSGGLRLDSRQSILTGGGRGPAIALGKPEESLLIKAVTHKHETLRMPPPGQLSETEISDLEKWIRDGAVWPESPEEFFVARVRPVLQANCLACHGDPPQGGLRLDSRAAVLKGGVSGPAAKPGDPEGSLLMRAVRHSDAKITKMPPAGSLSEREITDLAQWIRSGVAWSDTGTAASGYVITPEQRAFWSFQPPRRHDLPKLRTAGWARTPVDHFILARLEEKNLRPAPGAERRTLIRRATFDLLGLPPTPEEVEVFLADQSPDAYAKLIDRLLASPHYGERWGRHWLDLVRYADSAGDSSDYPIPQMRLYRDYVIDSFNRDKPYDQFIREQLAGDLLPAGSEPERWDHTVATGYLASARRFSVRPERNMHLTIEDTIDNLGKSFLGLSVGCARCHDHKYDPIPAKDYYALYGIFDSTRYPFAGSENVREQRDLVTRLPKSEVDALLKPHREELAPIDEQIKQLEEERTAAQNRTGTAPAGARTPDQLKSEIDKLQKLRKPILAKMPQLETAFAVVEGPPHDVRVQLRGEPRNLGEDAPRGFLQILGGQRLPAGLPASGRLQLAEWLADRSNPLTARVMVNRIWQHHFGKGLVASASDFGRRGTAPTHPELLDYLALRFVEEGWSIKKMHRLLMLSQVYRIASDGDARNAAVDPGNELLWKFNRRRLDAESIRDSMLRISGQLEARPSGEHPFPPPLNWSYTQHKPFAAVYDSRQRSVYLMTQRIQKHPYLSIFDGADTNLSTAERGATVTPIQALFVMNSEFVHEQAGHLARRLTTEFPDFRSRVDGAHRALLSRPARREEIVRAEQHLSNARVKLAPGPTPASQLSEQALASYVRALFASNEFLFVD